MYTSEASKLLLSDVETRAAKFALNNDRELFRVFLNIAEEYCADNQLVMGGAYGLALLTREVLTKDDYFMEIYADEALTTARELAELMFKAHSPHVDTRSVAVQTEIKLKEMVISVDSRRLVKVHKLDSPKAIKMTQLIGSARVSGLFTGREVMCTTPEVQIIAIYRTLYSPAQCGQWKAARESEQTLYKVLEDSLNVPEIIGGDSDGDDTETEDGLSADGGEYVLGGRDGPRNKRHGPRHNRGQKQHRTAPSSPALPAGQNTSNPHKDNSGKILRAVHARGGILLGDFALEALGFRGPSAGRLQFISDAEPDETCSALSAELRRKVIYKNQPVNIPGDFQLRKYTLSIADSKGEEFVGDMYNSTVFELIPCAEAVLYGKACRVPSLWVLLRFRFMEIWTLKIVAALARDKGLTGMLAGLKLRAQALLQGMDVLRDRAHNAPAVELFPLSGYVGTYMREDVVKKKLIRASGENFSTYYPYKAVLKKEALVQKPLLTAMAGGPAIPGRG